MTSPAGTAASASTVGQRSSQRRQRGTTRSTCVCCDITSLTRIAYGSLVFRQGRSLPFWLNQAKRSSSTDESLDQRLDGSNAENQPCEHSCEQTPVQCVQSGPGVLFSI